MQSINTMNHLAKIQDDLSPLLTAIYSRPMIGETENILQALQRMQKNVGYLSKRDSGMADVWGIVDSQHRLENVQFGIHLLAQHGMEFDIDPLEQTGNAECQLQLVSAQKLLKRYPELASFDLERFEGMHIFKLLRRSQRKATLN